MSAEAAIRSTLVAVSDTKLLLGYHYGEWTFGPPAIEAGIAACSMAQEEFGHTRLLNGILKREFGVEIDPLADTRAPDAFASVAFLDEPLADWGDLVAANAVVDLALSLELDAFGGGAWEPLARVVPKMLMEERFHWSHAEGWVRLVEREGGPARASLRRSLGRALRAADVWLGPAGHDAGLVEAGIKTASDDALRGRLFARIAGLLEDPATVGLAAGGAGWASGEPIVWEGWTPERRRVEGGGPRQTILDELRGTKNVAFKTA